DIDEPCGGMHPKARADRQEHVAGRGCRHRSVEDLRIEHFTEHDRGRLDDGSTVEAMRIGVTLVDALEDIVGQASVVTTGATSLDHVAVNLDHPIRIMSGSMVETIDVLRDECPESTGTFDLDERSVSRI